MRNRLLAMFGWLALKVLHLLWRVLATLGSRWARKKLDSAARPRSNPIDQVLRRRRTRTTQA